MKTVKVTMKFEFELEESDDQSIIEALRDAFDELDENGELLTGKTKVVVTDNEEESEDPELEEEEEE